MSDEARVDVAIVGGGIAGLWLLAELKAAGYSVLLCEAHALGDGQSLASQGIIHGGTKFALHGALSGAAAAIAAMPARWRQALQGDGAVDLRGARLLSDHQYLWSTERLGSRLSGFFASHLMRARMRSLLARDYPPALSDPGFSGTVYRLDEPVLDVVSVFAVLHQRYFDDLISVDPGYTRLGRPGGGEVLVDIRDRDERTLRIRAQRLVLCAGGGNEALGRALGGRVPSAQRRPLHMVMARGMGAALYAHCLGSGSMPRLTVTTHLDRSSQRVWYLGGALAEQGVGRSRDEQIAAARGELRELLPWIDLANTRWATLEVDRAEPATAAGGRPDGAVVESIDSVLMAWPTKLALAPALADQVLAALRSQRLTPRSDARAVSGGLQRPRPGLLPWDRELRWS